MSKIDYNLQLIKAIVFDIDGVLSPCMVPLSIDGIPQRMVNIRDSYAIQLAVKHGFEIAVVSGGRCEGIKHHLQSMGLQNIFTGVANKLPVLKKWMTLKGLRPEQVAYVGDDVPDLECMRHAGLPVAPADASTDIKNIARYISPIESGRGVARDLLEEILRANDSWIKCDSDTYW